AEALRAAADVLGATAAANALLDALRSTAASERAEAANALGALAVPTAARARARAALEHALADPDFVVAASAAGALSSLGSIAGVAALAAVYDGRRATHSDGDARLAAVEAIRDLTKPPLRPEWSGLGAFLARAAQDPDPRVAQAAAIGAAHLA